MKSTKLSLLAVTAVLLATTNAEAWDNHRDNDYDRGYEHSNNGWGNERGHEYEHNNHGHHDKYRGPRYEGCADNFVSYIYPSYNYDYYHYTPVRYNHHSSHAYYPNQSTITVIFR